MDSKLYAVKAVIMVMKHSVPDHADHGRCELGSLAGQLHRAECGLFMTPRSIARFMTSLFPTNDNPKCRLLNAGAGVGALTGAFLERYPHSVKRYAAEKRSKIIELEPRSDPIRSQIALNRGKAGGFGFQSVEANQ